MFSGGKDGQVIQISSDGSYTNVATFESAVRAIDRHGGSMVVGLRNGTIMQDGREVMYSHSDGEVWGLDVSDYPNVCTSADDNQVIVWDTRAHKKA